MKLTILFHIILFLGSLFCIKFGDKYVSKKYLNKFSLYNIICGVFTIIIHLLIINSNLLLRTLVVVTYIILINTGMIITKRTGKKEYFNLLKNKLNNIKNISNMNLTEIRNILLKNDSACPMYTIDEIAEALKNETT